MAMVIFYEKVGCSGNARQKALLGAAGHTVASRDLLGTEWTRDALLEFLEPLPVAQWFNRNAPEVKSGRVQPDRIDRDAALELLAQQPWLIRRPLMQVGGERRVGFDVAAVDAWIGLAGSSPTENLETCRHGLGGHECGGRDHDADLR